jgi:hypothetical protein
MKTKLLSVAALAALLTACGGGGGGSTTSTATPKTDAAIASAASTTKAALGATDLGTATTQVYDVAADIGDTWRITFNTATNAYSIAVLNTVYGLTNTVAGTGGTFTSTTSGNLTNYALTPTSGSVGSLSVDTRTKDISGKLTVGGKSSTVMGTSTAVSDLTKLAGIYNFLSASKNATNGLVPDSLGGQIKINDDGATATICVGGTFATGSCAPVDSTSTPETVAMTLKNDTSTGVSKVLMEFVTPQYGTEKSFGIVNIQAGDLGPVLIIDQFARNAEGILRTGTFYAVKQQQLNVSDLDGTWGCSRYGLDTTSLVVTTSNGITTNKVTELGVSNPYIGVETLIGNKVVTSNGTTQTTVNGFGVSVASNGSGVTFLPLSSSLTVVSAGNAYRLNVCRKQ